VKLVQEEAESEALRRFLRRHRSDERVTSALAGVEVVRAVQPGGGPAVARAHRQLSRMYQVSVDTALLDLAGTMAPGSTLRSLDAVHLASAQLIGTDLRSVVTYDRRMTEAAATMGFRLDAPA
jgi:predicted nucleic acid-binding protein